MKKSIIALSTILMLFSCSRELLDTTPTATKVTSQFYKDAAQLEQGVNAAYSILQFNGLYRLGMPTVGEIPSDNTFDEVPANDAFTFGEFDFFTIQPNNTLLGDIWRHSYVGIQQANIILNRINGIADMTQEAKNARIGEMKFLRGLLYFNLVRVYGDVPLVTKETTDVNSYFGQGRTAQNLVYDQILADLKEAVTLLPSTTSQKGRATKGAALGILAKVLMTKKDFAGAIPYLKQIETLGYSLLPEAAKVFDINNENNAEIIFDVQFASGLNGNTEGSPAFQQFSPSGTVSGAKGHNLPTKEVYSLFTANDKRRTAYIGLTANGVPFTKKLVKTSSTIADGGSNWVILRYADVLLMLAESYAETGDLANANKYLNLIKTRAGISTVNLTSKAALLEEVDKERRLELVGEGHRWFDLLRTDKTIPVMQNHFANTPGYSTASIKPYNLLMPIPQSQINTDPSIKQNQGY